MNFFQNVTIVQTVLGWLAVLSVFTFIISLFFIPWIIGRLSPDYFLRIMEEQNSILSMRINMLVILLLKNILALVLLCAGIAMLFLPGQGILTLIVGLFLLSFPGKKKFIALLIKHHTVQQSLNWIRTKRGKQHFLWPTDT